MSKKDREVFELLMKDLDQNNSESEMSGDRTNKEYLKYKKLFDGLEDYKTHRKEAEEVPGNYWYFFQSRLREKHDREISRPFYQKALRSRRFHSALAGVAAIVFLVVYPYDTATNHSDQASAGKSDSGYNVSGLMEMNIDELDEAVFGAFDPDGGLMAAETGLGVSANVETNELTSLEQTIGILEQLK